MSAIDDAIKKLKAFEAKLVTKALEDDAFRKKLLKDPKKTLAAMAGKELPDALIVKIQEVAPDALTIVLPQKPKKAEAKGELSAEALKKVAGGIEGIVAVTVVTQVGVAAIADA
ncbi:MAG: NHLP leader peptide family RiPP precursor [Planctomycetota bacterium]